MRQPSPTYFAFALTVPWLLVHCSNGSSSPSSDAGTHNGGSSGQASTTAAGKGGGAAATGGVGGSTGGTGAATTGGVGGSTGGTGGSAGHTTGGTSAIGGMSGSSGAGVVGTGGSAGGSGGTGGSSGGSGGTGGSGGSAGMTTGGAGMAGGAGASTCLTTDQNGKANWKPGDMTSTTQDYLRSCDIRLINNNWGAAALNCPSGTSSYSVFVNTDGSFGWNFNRGNCDTQDSNQDPDFPEIEFGVHPFGAGSSLATTPDFSSTTLLPIQISAIQSASVTIDNMNISLQLSGSWDLTFEFWVSQQDPATNPSPGVYAELMTFWGWQNGRYPEPPNGKGPTGTGAGDTVSAGDKTYKLEVQSDTWASGQWRYFQFRDQNGPQMNFSGKVDVKALIDYLVTNRGYSNDFWISRFEVGSEIDDLTQGKVTLDKITFEVNGQTRSAGKP